MVDAFDACRDADIAKVDIERAEWAIVAGPRQAQLRAYAVVWQWHLRESPEPDAAALATASCKRPALCTRAGLRPRQAATSCGRGVAKKPAAIWSGLACLTTQPGLSRSRWR
jgi:hypothetical protein